MHVAKIRGILLCVGAASGMMPASNCRGEQSFNNSEPICECVGGLWMHNDSRRNGRAMRLHDQPGRDRELRKSSRLQRAIEALEPRLFLSATYPLAPAKSPLVGAVLPAVHQVTVHKPLRTHRPPHKQPDLFPPDTGDD